MEATKNQCENALIGIRGGEKDGRPIKATGGKQLVYSKSPDSMARVKMVRTDKWKLAIRETGGNELFDVVNDPQEMNNLFSDSKYNAIVIDLQQQLIEWCLKTDTDRPYQKVVGA